MPEEGKLRDGSERSVATEGSPEGGVNSRSEGLQEVPAGVDASEAGMAEPPVPERAGPQEEGREQSSETPAMPDHTTSPDRAGAPDGSTPDGATVPDGSTADRAIVPDRAAPDRTVPPVVSTFGVTKFDLMLAGKGSTLHDGVCLGAGASKGCDVCKALGYDKDYLCDRPLVDVGLCKDPDPDCQPRGAKYYVAPQGKDTNAGTKAAPFATVQKAHDMASAGDLIYVRGGTYRPTAATVFKKAGSAASPIVLQAYPGEKVLIDASKLPDGNISSGSTPTWIFRGAKHWKLIGPIHLTKGRGAGVMIEKDTHFVEFVFIESSYNGQRAARAGHGFSIIEAQWADARDIHFLNCDAHHNANHLVKSGENAADNRYQHGDGFRIKSGKNIRLTGCRSWHNLDDGYDLVWAKDKIVLHNTWAAYTGYDDAQGSITGTANWAAAWGEGIKLGYTSDTGPHVCVGCLSWRNVHLGFRMDGGPNTLYHCTSYKNGRRALGWDLGKQKHIIRNCLDFETRKKSTIPSTTSSLSNSWDTSTGVSVSAADFVSLDDSKALGPRAVNGMLPVSTFLQLAPQSDLRDAGVDVGHFFFGRGPDLGCFQRP